jgi:hypothetical protein
MTLLFLFAMWATGASSSVPSEVAVPADNVLAHVLFANGVLSYSCPEAPSPPPPTKILILAPSLTSSCTHLLFLVSCLMRGCQLEVGGTWTLVGAYANLYYSQGSFNAGEDRIGTYDRLAQADSRGGIDRWWVPHDPSPLFETSAHCHSSFGPTAK